MKEGLILSITSGRAATSEHYEKRDQELPTVQCMRERSLLAWGGGGNGGSLFLRRYVCLSSNGMMLRTSGQLLLIQVNGGQVIHGCPGKRRIIGTTCDG